MPEGWTHPITRPVSTSSSHPSPEGNPGGIGSDAPNDIEDEFELFGEGKENVTNPVGMAYL
jgi:hypothetical protein